MNTRSEFVIIILIILLFFPAPKSMAQLSRAYQYDVSLPADPGKTQLTFDFYRAIVHLKAGHPSSSSLKIKSAVLDYNRFRQAGNPLDSLDVYQTELNPDLQIASTDSTIRISNATQRNIIFIEIAVPPVISVKATAAHFGRFNLEGITGNIDLKNYTGQINLRDVQGTVSAESIRDGSISMNFDKVTPVHAAVITTYSGDITLSLPPKAGINIRMRTELGDIKSDFDFNKTMKKKGPVMKQHSSQSEQQNSPYFWLDTQLNQGGPLCLIQTIRGDILLNRKN